MNRISFVLVAMLAACGDDSGSSGGADARRVDASAPADAAGCVASANYGNVTIMDADQSASGGDTTAVNSSGALTQANYEWAAVLGNETPAVALMIMDFWEGYGAFAGAEGVHTGTINLTGDELSVADCGLCIFLLSDLVIQNGMIMDAGEQFFQTGGSVTLTAVPTGNHRPAVADGGFVADGPVAPDGGWGALTGTINNLTMGITDSSGEVVANGCTTGVMMANINDPAVERLTPPGKRVKDGQYGARRHRMAGLVLRGGGEGPVISK